MKSGSKFAAFLSGGAKLIVPASMSGRPRAVIAAGLVGFAFLAAPAHAQTAITAPGTPTAPRIVAPTTVPPYAKDVKAPAPTVAAQAVAAPQVRSQAVSAPAPTQAAPARTAAAPRGTPTQDWRSRQAASPQNQDRSHGHHDREFSAAPIAAAIGAMIGMQQQPFYVAPAYDSTTYAQAPGYYDQGHPYGARAAESDGYGPSYAPYPGPQVEQGGYQAGAPRPVPADGRMLDPESAGKIMNLGGQAFDARDVFATVAAARIIGVDPSALFALESRSESAMQRFSQMGGQDNPAADIAGPYAYGAQRWLAAYARFAPAAGIPGAQNAVIRSSDGTFDVRNPQQLGDVMSQRESRYVASLLVAAEMQSNDTRYRQIFGTGPTMAELVIGHHIGGDGMIRYSQLVRQSPDAPLASVMREGMARDLLMLTGMVDVQPNVRAWSIGAFQERLDNALKNGLARFAMAKSVQLPPDYKPGFRNEAHATPAPAMR